MSLKHMLQAFDDISLEAISSKGVIRRAKRDLSSSAHTLVETSDEQATLSTDGHTVTLTALGPKKAICTCPATGVCRHIVLSVLALKECSESSPPKNISVDDSTTPKSTPEPTSASTLTSAKDKALQLTQEQLKKYAGADWPQALIIADGSDTIDVSEHGLNCTLSISDALVKVTLISGQGLKDSIYKGPKTKQRLLTTVCVILLRKQSGITLEQATDVVSAASTSIDFEYLNTAKQEILRSISAVLNGTPEIAVNRLYDLAISARLQSAPRLVSQLRTLAKFASLATTRHIQFQPSTYIRYSANTYSLLLALEKDPNDFALTGVLKRDFLKTEPLELWMLGAMKWRTPNGARGLTAYGFSAQTKQWYSVTNARAAGNDPLFDPVSVYSSQVWDTGILSDLIGSSILLELPRISTDKQIPLTLESPGRDLKTRLSWRELIESGACYASVLDLRAYLSETLGVGVRRGYSSKPFLFAPENYTNPYFNDIDQHYYLGIVDNAGNVIELQFSAQQSELVDDLVSIQYKIKALLITAEYGTDSIKYKLCSVLTNEKGGINIFNASFDKIVRTKTMLDKLKSRISSYTASEHSIDVDPISLLSESVIDACVKLTTSTLSDDECQALKRKAEIIGLEYLAHAIKQMQTGPEAMLRAVYIASEIQLLANTT